MIFISRFSSEESKPDSDLDEPWIMTVKGLHAHPKPSIFTLGEASFSNGSSNSSSPSRDVNLNHLNHVNPAQRSHNQSFSPSSSPTREVPESPTQKSIVLLKEKKEDRYVIESAIETVKNEEFVLKSPEKEFERPIKHDVSLNRHSYRASDSVTPTHSSQVRENDKKEEAHNGRTAINIPGEPSSPKSKTPPAVVEKRHSTRHEQPAPPKEHRERDREREHHRDHNGAKVSNHHNNNHKANSACLNNLILPLLSDVSNGKKLLGGNLILIFQS